VAAPPFAIRSATPDDLPGISLLAEQLVRMHHRWDQARFMLVDGVAEGYRWFFARELRRRKAVILVAERESAIVGYAYATLESRNWNDLLDACGKLHDLFVEERSRRAGVARALLKEMLARLQALGAPRVVLLSAWENPEAQAFFASAGFRKTMIEMTCELPTPEG
jgi:ribosomal protein S18 acetylase RimI-like enzyme